MRAMLSISLLVCIGIALPPAPAGAAPGVRDRIVARFMELDTDHSGAVSLDEYMAMVAQRAEERFRAMDTNHDGVVDPEERAAFWRREQARWYRLDR
ncbi:MAG: thymidylate synthase [Zetaproteobacteria bacterium]|nr:MAG: thymidylate synthase [Zetaproteobacteria bacterium]